MRKFIVVAAGLAASGVAFSLNAPPVPIDLEEMDYIINVGPDSNPSNDIYRFGAAPEVTITPTLAGAACVPLMNNIAPGAPKNPQRCGTYTADSTETPVTAITGTWIYFNGAKPPGGWNASNIYFRDRLMMVPDTANVLWTSKFTPDNTTCAIDNGECGAGRFNFCGTVEFYDSGMTLRGEGDIQFCANP